MNMYWDFRHFYMCKHASILLNFFLLETVKVLLYIITNLLVAYFLVAKVISFLLHG